ncbi:MAG TPA: two-component regulator propeller domain-containing protein, partial [Puia sp.]
MRSPLTLLWLILLVHSCYAQQYLFARYTPKDGLINNRTRFLYQDSRGRIYISTFGGLSVYDGSRFVNYTTDNGLATSLVNDVLEMGDDSLWVVPNGAALHCLVHGIFKDIHTADGFYPVINQLLRGSDGTLYAISDNGLFRFEQNRFVRIPLTDPQGRAQEGAIAQAVEVDHRLLLLTDPWTGAFPGPGSLIIYDLQKHRLTAMVKGPDYLFLLKSAGDSIFTATATGLRLLDPEAFRRDTIRCLHLPAPWRAADGVACRYAYFDRRHDLWLSIEQRLIRIDATTGTAQNFTTANGLPPGITAGILHDREDNIWFANDRNGI